MLSAVGVESLDDLYSHIPPEIRFDESHCAFPEMSSEQIRKEISSIASKNKAYTSDFLGDALPNWKLEKIVEKVSSIRGLSTAYTPYQPERSQGTLATHWIWQCAISALTGFEAVNCSLYDRASAIFEAVATALRATRKYKAIISESLFPQDLEVLKTFCAHTSTKLVFARIDSSAGLTDIGRLREIIEENPDAGCLVFPQVSCFGTLENTDELVRICAAKKLKSVAVIDPFLLGAGGLAAPSDFGGTGVDIAVGEGQHLCSAPSFGGPGLGIYAVRFNDANKTDVRYSPGRFVGRAKDISGRDAFVMVMAAREQHIRHERATSNICSNQAFMATLAGAALLAKGDEGMGESIRRARSLAETAFSKIMSLGGYSYPFGATPFFNEFTINCPTKVDKILRKGAELGIRAGCDVSGRNEVAGNLLKISFSDLHSENDISALVKLLAIFAEGKGENRRAPRISASYLRQTPPHLPRFDFEALAERYEEYGKANVSPDDSPYPLGSCTMKYNPLLNDELANLRDFQSVHPQSGDCDSQGSLEILWRFGEFIKGITGLDAIALQPVAGAQGEYCALKMFQAWHADNSRGARDVVLLPSTAHGTNFASSAVAGYSPNNIIRIPAGNDGTLDISALKEAVSKYGNRIAAIMITNPNTSGIFEKNFREIADIIHKAGGLVYMDGANYNAIAGRINLKAMGVDAMHNNIHKTWSISHGGGGPGDGFVVVDAKLADYIPSYVVANDNGIFRTARPKRSIGSLHRHFGNFAHKVRALAYAMKLGGEGVRKMSACAVLSSRYVMERMKSNWLTLPKGAESEPRMHEFIASLPENAFKAFESAGVNRQSATARAGKLFLDFGFHAPTVAFPEVYGLMIEPTESYDKDELDRFADAANAIESLICDNPAAAARAPRFTPVDRIDETEANRKLVLSEPLTKLPQIPQNRISPEKLNSMSIDEICSAILSD